MAITLSLLIWPCLLALINQQSKLQCQRRAGTRIAEMNNEISKLNENRKALIKDKDHIEKVARDKMGWSGSEELIYKFDDEEQK